MTIADAFNEITAAQGGTPNYSGTIAAAIDALNDALAGSDQPAEQTIEGAVRLLGQHIGGGGGTQTTIWYLNENESSDAPAGTVSVDGEPVTYSTTADYDGVTIYGYEVPLGSLVKYEPPSGTGISDETYYVLSDDFSSILCETYVNSGDYTPAVKNGLVIVIYA